MINYTIYEDGNGGQLYWKNNDIQITKSLSTLAYIYMFGGNIESDTVRNNEIGNLRFDWWGNSIENNSSKWMNSETERTLRGIDLTVSSRIKIEQSVKQDLKRLEKYGNVDVVVAITGLNKLEIQITITQPNNNKNEKLLIVWDATKNEIIDKIIV